MKRKARTPKKRGDGWRWQSGRLVLGLFDRGRRGLVAVYICHVSKFFLAVFVDIAVF